MPMTAISFFVIVLDQYGLEEENLSTLSYLGVKNGNIWQTEFVRNGLFSLSDRLLFIGNICDTDFVKSRALTTRE